MRKNDMNLWWGMWWLALAVFLCGWFCLLTGCGAVELPPAEIPSAVKEETYTLETEPAIYYARLPDIMVTAEEPIEAQEPDHIPDATEMVEEPAPPAEPELLGWFKVTAYCACRECCGKDPSDPWYGITATGTRATQGRTIAVDPKVIPYGTVVYFEGPDGTLTGYVAEDCGGAINGNDIDLYFDTHEEAKAWGVKERDVYVMTEDNR